MNKNEKEMLQQKIVSVEETLALLKHQESNLLEAMVHHNYDHNEKIINQWVQEVFLGCEYIVRLESSLQIMKAALKPRRKRGGKKED